MNQLESFSPWRNESVGEESYWGFKMETNLRNWKAFLTEHLVLNEVHEWGTWMRFNLRRYFSQAVGYQPMVRIWSSKIALSINLSFGFIKGKNRICSTEPQFSSKQTRQHLTSSSGNPVSLCDSSWIWLKAGQVSGANNAHGITAGIAAYLKKLKRSKD